MIDKELAWQHIFSKAKKALATNMIFHSLVEKRAYKIIGVEHNKIIISRESGGENSTLTKAIVFKALDNFNSANCQPFKRRTLIEKPVVQETTLVLFCPYLTWDATGDYIIATNL